MKTFISATASQLLKQLEATLIQQEEILTPDEKIQYPFWYRVITAATRIYRDNRVKVTSMNFIAIDKGYSLTVNKETVSFLHDSEVETIVNGIFDTK